MNGTMDSPPPASTPPSSLALTSRQPLRKQQRTEKVRQNLPLYAMLLPVFAFYLIFKYVPMGGLIIAFKNYNFADGILHSPWAGLKAFSIFIFFLQYAANFMEYILVKLFKHRYRISRPDCSGHFIK